MDLMYRRDRLPTTLAEEDAKVAELRAAIGPQSGHAAVFCSDSCLKRYLRARSWHVKKAEKMLRDSLTWREQFRPHEIRWEDVSHEGETGKLYRTNFYAKNGDSVLVLAPGRQNTNNHDNQIKHLVYCLENAVTFLPEGREQMVWLIDYRGWTLRMSPPLKTSRETLNILQNHYPERLSAALLYNSPPVFEVFWRMIRPFMDPKTVKKVKFINPKLPDNVTVMEEVFDLDQLDKQFGGNSTWIYDHEGYTKWMKEDDEKTAALWGLPLKGKGITS